MQVAAHVAAGNAQSAHQRDHDVREILANPTPRAQRVVDRRIHLRAVRRVLEGAKERGIQIEKCFDRRRAPRHMQLALERVQQVGRPGVAARQEHVPIVPGVHARIQTVPIQNFAPFNRRRLAHIDDGLRDDLNVILAAGDIEVMHGVPEKILIRHDVGLRSDIQ